MESFLAAATKPQVLTTTTSAAASSASTSSQPSSVSRPANSSESTSLRAHPRVTSTARGVFVGPGTGSGYLAPSHDQANQPPYFARWVALVVHNTGLGPVPVRLRA